MNNQNPISEKILYKMLAGGASVRDISNFLNDSKTREFINIVDKFHDDVVERFSNVSNKDENNENS